MTQPSQSKPTPNPLPSNPTDPQQSSPENNIQGEALELDEMLNFAVIDLADIESAAQWWDDHASAAWVGVLDEAARNG